MYNINNHYQNKRSNIMSQMGLVTIITSIVLNTMGILTVTASLLLLMSVIMFVYEPINNIINMHDVFSTHKHFSYKVLMIIRIIGWVMLTSSFFMTTIGFLPLLIGMFIVLYTTLEDQNIEMVNGWSL